MLPPSLNSTYKQYKLDTTYIANWLAQTATTCGYSLLPASSSSSSRAPKKGKKKSTAKSASTDQKQEIKTNDFVLLANHIALQKPSVEVPISFINTTKRAIIARQRSCAYYNAKNAPDSEDGHLHFIQVLTSVLDTLKPLVPAPPPPPTDEEESIIENAFSLLDIEDHSEEPPTPPKSASDDAVELPPEPLFRAEPMPEINKEPFATWCLFIDINDTLKQVRAIWRAYAAGEINLISASMAANTAVDLVDRLEQDFLEEFPTWTDGWQIAQNHYKTLCGQRGISDDFKIDSAGTMDFGSFEVAEFVLLPGFLRITRYADRYLPEAKPIYQPSSSRQVDNPTFRDEKSAQERVLEDNVLFNELWPLLHWLIRIRIDGKSLAMDDFTTYMQTYLSTKDTSLSLALAVANQGFIEAHHALTPHSDKAFNELQQLSHAIKDTAAQTLELGAIPPHTETDHTFRLKWLINAIDTNVFTDPIHAHAQAVKSKRRKNPFHPFAILQHHPLHCGILAAHLAATAHRGALCYANRFSTMLCSAHLLNALQHEKYCTRTYPQLELFLKYQGDERLFLGSRPTTRATYKSRFALVIGGSVTQYASTRRGNSSGFEFSSARHPRYLELAAPFMMLLDDWHGGRLEAGFGKVQHFLNGMFEGASVVDAEGGLKEVGVQVRRKKQSRGKIDNDSKGKGKRAEKKIGTVIAEETMLKPPELLLAMQKAIERELPALRFDYLALERQCVAMLDRVVEEIHHGDLEPPKKFYELHKKQPALVVAFLLPHWNIEGHRMPKVGEIVEEFLTEMQEEAAGEGEGGMES